MRVAKVRKFCKLDEAGDSLVRAAMSQLNLSARGYHRVLKLARMIADLAGSHQIHSVHLAEALHATQSPEVDDGLNKQVV
jgi:magnesium chelatase family protein